jgi:hypothetical protein
MRLGVGSKQRRRRRYARRPARRHCRYDLMIAAMRGLENGAANRGRTVGPLRRKPASPSGGETWADELAAQTPKHQMRVLAGRHFRPVKPGQLGRARPVWLTG